MKKREGQKKTRILVCILMVCIFLILRFFILPLGEELGSKDDAEEALSSMLPSAETDVWPTTEPTEPKVDKTSQYLILVNKNHGIDSGYVPSDLVPLEHVAKSANPDYQKLRKAPAEAFERLAAEAEEDGCKVAATSGFRPYAYQASLHKEYKNRDRNEDVKQYSAKPGYSEHETGLALDVSAASVEYELVQELGKSKEGKWLAKNSYIYGFIIRYPKGKEKITGYEYEPWHLRYVGRDAAREIYEQKVTLEEYLDKVE